MDTRRSGEHRWAFPPDLLFALGIPIIFVALVTEWVLDWLFRARTGDPWFFGAAVAIGVAGIAMLFVARLPLYRQHRFWCIGSRELPDRSRVLYRRAYCLITVSVLLLAMLLLIVR
jgi:hypothetical protein